MIPRIKLGQPATVFTDAGGRASRQGQLHLVESGVHAAQRADGGGPVEARLSREDRRRQPSGRAQAGHAGRGGDSPSAMSDRLLQARSRHEEVRRRRRRARSVDVDRAGRDVRPDRAGRRRQDDDDPADVRAAEGRRRERAGAGPRSRQGAPARSRSRSAICRSASACTAT